MKKRIFSFLLAVLMILGMFPLNALADPTNSKVRVIVSNDTYSKADGAPWEGTLVDEWVNIDQNSTMMSAVVDALTKNDYEQEGAENNYISTINGLSEFDGGSMSGWMGTLNDWFTNEGFGAFTVKDGTLNDGDEIHIMYTCDYGEDLGGSWGNANKKVKAVSFSAGTLDKTFSPDAKEYILTVPAETTALTVTPTAANKNYQVRTSVGTTEYKRTASVPVVDGTVITVKCGDPKWPSMNGSDGDAQVYTFTVKKEEAVLENRSMTVNVAPKAVNVVFKKGDTALTSGVEDKGEVKVGSYTYHQYVLTVPAGEYSYVGTESGTNLGGEVFTVADTEDAQTLNLLRVNVRYNGASLNEEGDYAFTLKNGEKEVIYGTPYVSSNIRYTPTLLIAGVAHTGTTTLAEKWEDEFYLTSNGAISNTPSKTTGNAATINLPITQYKIIRVTAPKDAATTFYKQDANYVVEPVTPDTSTDNGDTVTYQFKGTAAHSNYQFRSMMNGKVTQAGYLADGNNITVTFPDRAPSSTNSTMDYDDKSVLLNVNAKNKLNLKVGDTFKLRAFRAAWEIINTTTANQMIEPDFHYQILSGNGVISITPTTEGKNEKFPNAINGNATGNWMNIEAKKAGTAIVAVYYDAIDVYNANPPAASAFSTFGATDPSRYGIFVVTVGDDEDITWNPASQDGDWDAEFDTVYYVGDSGIFTFKPTESVNSVTVRNVLGTDLGTAQTVSAEADGSYKVPVTTGANIIAVETANGTDYQIVRAKKISYTITNETTDEMAINSAPDIKTGDQVTISFGKLDMPVPKMSGVYNPGYMGTAKTAYEINGKSVIMSTGTQYDFASSPKSNITFTAHFAGTNSLKGYISLSSMGDPFGNHRNINDDGKPVNMNAGEVFGSFGSLPDISFEVTDSGEPASYEDATAITALKVMGANSTGYLKGFTDWAKVGNGDSNWTATTAAMAAYAITANVKTKDYNNTLELRYWYDGEEAKSIKLNSGVTATVPNFTLNADKILNLQVVVTPLDETLGEAKSYTYIVYPGNTNQKYVHPVIKSLTAKAGEKDLTISPAFDTANLSYTLDVEGNDKITLNAEQLIKIYNTATAADKSDKVVLTKLKGGKVLGDPITILEGGEPTNPNRYWEHKDLDIAGADALQIVVTSYVDETTARTYSIKLKNPKKTAAPTEYKAVLNDTLEQLTKTVTEPKFGTDAGEWTVLALARGGFAVPEGYFEGYYSRVAETVKTTAASVNLSGALHKNKSTENARAILALTAIGKNVTNVGGVDLVGAYAANGLNWIKKQGINGPIFALIALDCGNYLPDNTALRQECIDHILNLELATGGWTLSGNTMNVDITAMALQALANYKNQPAVAAAADRAFAALSNAQAEDGNFTYGGAASSESNAQVIVALAAWGIDADTDSRFVKNEHSALEALLSYYVADGKGFAHVLESGGGYTGGEVNGMATDQAAYALVAYDRFKAGKTALYDMSDVKLDVVTPTEPTDPDPTPLTPEVVGEVAKAEVPEDTEVKEDEPLIFSATTEEDVDKVEVTIPAAVMGNIDKAEKLELQTSVGTIAFDKEALGQMAGASDVSISMEAGEANEEDGSVTFTLTATDADGKNVFEGGSGSATISVDFEAPSEGKEIHVYYVQEDGTKTRVPAKYENGKLIFTVEHFSEYLAIEENADVKVTAMLTLPENIENKAESTFNAIVTLDAFPEGMRLIDGIMPVPEGVKVTGVTMGSGIKGGELSYNVDESNSLRIVYFDANEGTILTAEGSETPIELMTVSFELKNPIDAEKLTVALSGLSFKETSETEDMLIVDTANAYDTVNLVKGTAFSVVKLYQGDGIDLIPENKMAIAVFAVGITPESKLTYKADTDEEIVLKYNAAITEKTSVPTYLALVSSDLDLKDFTVAENYIVENEKPAMLTFGDTNGDGLINAQDALNAVNFWLRKDAPTDDQILSSNINGDSRLNTLDAIGIVEAFVDGKGFTIVTAAATAKPAEPEETEQTETVNEETETEEKQETE